jgi:hypothetical protein
MFFGRLQGLFEALNAETGELLWQVQSGKGALGPPISFQAAIISRLCDIAGRAHGLRFGMTR